MGKLLDIFSSAGKVAINCPFHDEKNPSCVYDTKNDTFHCFGCGANGSGDELKVAIDDEVENALSSLARGHREKSKICTEYTMTKIERIYVGCLLLVPEVPIPAEIAKYEFSDVVCADIVRCMMDLQSEGKLRDIVCTMALMISRYDDKYESGQISSKMSWLIDCVPDNSSVNVFGDLLIYRLIVDQKAFVK